MGTRLRRLGWALPIGIGPAVVGGATLSPPDPFTNIAYVAAAFAVTLLLGYHVAAIETPADDASPDPDRLWLFAGTLLVFLIVTGAVFSRVDTGLLWDLPKGQQLAAVAGIVGGLFLLAELVIYYGPFDRLYGLFR
ncbi:hypothetical protein [Haloarchaeobius iranensis]|uniref:Uncharacterized protein n=1 Tax=Haloarchaeobius iranensis TaxID=996166 RepID=A0A1G9XNT6_9EURY|nr:hypothetical protein [Haloarchaeobius iranensis]SDM98151.1 hypothetical protein SAMN05192554_11146 [Haloarchaeobius iranensis]